MILKCCLVYKFAIKLVDKIVSTISALHPTKANKKPTQINFFSILITPFFSQAECDGKFFHAEIVTENIRNG